MRPISAGTSAIIEGHPATEEAADCMAKTDISSIPQKMFKLIKDCTPEERQRVITATLTLFDERYVAPTGSGGGGGAPGSSAAFGGGAGGGALTVRQFFDQKKPQGKTEELAVAVRYLEQYGNVSSPTKEQIGEAVTSAKRNFDSKNFGRDLGNARAAKLFNVGKQIQLSHNGDSYVDALPDREAASALKKSAPKTGKGGRKKARKNR
jgi:hypothetical protein